jgi:hypothetical protein
LLGIEELDKQKVHSFWANLALDPDHQEEVPILGALKRGSKPPLLLWGVLLRHAAVGHDVLSNNWFWCKWVWGFGLAFARFP